MCNFNQSSLEIVEVKRRNGSECGRKSEIGREQLCISWLKVELGSELVVVV